MSAQDDAATLVAMNVADLAGHLDGLDLDTLNAALALENAREGGPRKGAVAALTAAVEGHPELAASAALAAEDGEASGDAIMITPLADKPTDPDAVSAAPPRPHQSLIDQLELRWGELLTFVRALDGDVEGPLGEVLTFVRSKI